MSQKVLVAGGSFGSIEPCGTCMVNPLIDFQSYTRDRSDLRISDRIVRAMPLLQPSIFSSGKCDLFLMSMGARSREEAALSMQEMKRYGTINFAPWELAFFIDASLRDSNVLFPLVGVQQPTGLMLPAIRSGEMDLVPGTPDVWRSNVLCYRMVDTTG